MTCCLKSSLFGLSSYVVKRVPCSCTHPHRLLSSSTTKSMCCYRGSSRVWDTGVFFVHGNEKTRHSTFQTRSLHCKACVHPPRHCTRASSAYNKCDLAFLFVLHFQDIPEEVWSLIFHLAHDPEEKGSWTSLLLVLGRVCKSWKALTDLLALDYPDCLKSKHSLSAFFITQKNGEITEFQENQKNQVVLNHVTKLTTLTSLSLQHLPSKLNFPLLSSLKIDEASTPWASLTHLTNLTRLSPLAPYPHILQNFPNLT